MVAYLRLLDYDLLALVLYRRSALQAASGLESYYTLGMVGKVSHNNQQDIVFDLKVKLIVIVSHKTFPFLTS